jgi:3'-phosphoadenosine 5'-phosphosulfate sulfotransferase (PAPS reductase)/FAD synthetase
VTFVAFSGGKDSTAMAYRMAELGEEFSILFTPTGNELPALRAHIDRVVADIGRPMVIPPNKSLGEWIAKWGALPNTYQRWCTRVIKIEPCAAFLKANSGSTLCVGLRADEEERTGGIYGDSVTYRTPLREWGWTLEDVRSYLDAKGVCVPKRTDCAVCPFQRLGEWHSLWKEEPAAWAEGEAWEAQTGHTFRRGRNGWPASMAGLAEAFARGKEPQSVAAARQGNLFDDEDDAVCRVCSL